YGIIAGCCQARLHHAQGRQEGQELPDDEAVMLAGGCQGFRVCEQLQRPLLIEILQGHMVCLHLAPERMEAMGVRLEGGWTIVLALQGLKKLLRRCPKRITAGGRLCQGVVSLCWSHVMLLVLRVKEQAYACGAAEPTPGGMYYADSDHRWTSTVRGT